jgi:hypothetical protein
LDDRNSRPLKPPVESERKWVKSSRIRMSQEDVASWVGDNKSSRPSQMTQVKFIQVEIHPSQNPSYPSRNVIQVKSTEGCLSVERGKEIRPKGKPSQIFFSDQQLEGMSEGNLLTNNVRKNALKEFQSVVKGKFVYAAPRTLESIRSTW